MMTRRAFLLAGILAVGRRAAAGLDVDVGAYFAAGRAGSHGAVTGRASASRIPDAPRLPLDGTVVLLSPRSARLLAGLQAVKRRSRDSLNDFQTAVASMRGVVEDHLREVREAGAGGLVRTVTADAGGRFALDDVPVGAWLLIALHAGPTKTSPSPGKTRSSRKSEATFLPQSKLLSYESVTLWLQELTVEPERAEVVELTDRNAWFTGIEEKRTRPDAGR